jgi:flagellar hook assembly protein FlgD
VRAFHWDALPAGDHSVRWDGRDQAGRSLGSGVYLYRFEADDFVATQRMSLIK